MIEKREDRARIVLLGIAAALFALDCGGSEPVGGFLTFTQLENPACSTTSDPTTTTMVVEGIIENIAGDKAVNVQVVASFFVEPLGGPSGASPICTASLSLGDMAKETQTIKTLTCVTQDSRCPQSYTVAFPNNHYAGYAGAF